MARIRASSAAFWASCSKRAAPSSRRIFSLRSAEIFSARTTYKSISPRTKAISQNYSYLFLNHQPNRANGLEMASHTTGSTLSVVSTPKVVHRFLFASEILEQESNQLRSRRTSFGLVRARLSLDWLWRRWRNIAITVLRDLVIRMMPAPSGCVPLSDLGKPWGMWGVFLVVEYFNDPSEPLGVM